MGVPWRIVDAEYIGTRDVDTGGLPEIAVVGRSNVGKSSLINAMCGRKSLARTSSTPGRTQQLQVFSVRFLADLEQRRDETALLVDFPGYGYAKAGKAARARWTADIEKYLYGENQLRAFLVLVDIRRELEEEEQWFLHAETDAKRFVVLTKCDKVKKNEKQKRRQYFRSALEGLSISLIATSASEGAKGTRELVQTLGATLWPE